MSKTDDALYSQAVDIVVTSQRVSVSAIQRQLRIGFSQACGYIDEMQTLGIVSAPDAVGRRTVLIADPVGSAPVSAQGHATRPMSPAQKSPSDERPDDDLKAWAEWNRKPGDERPGVQQARLKRYDLITNYRCGSAIEEMERDDKSGDWVRYEDVEPMIAAVRADLEAENRRLREALEKLVEAVEHKDNSYDMGVFSGDDVVLKAKALLAAADTGRPERS